MTEVEAYGLHRGDPVIMRRPGRTPRWGTVEEIKPYGLSWQMAMDICGLSELDARAFQFDGPIVCVHDSDGRHTIWSALHVWRASIKIHCECRKCKKVLKLHVPYDAYVRLSHGEELEKAGLEQDVRDALVTELCEKCR